MKHILSLSGGKDSTWLLFELVRRKLPLDEVVFFDTGWEFPQMYQHLEQLSEFCKINNIKFVNLRPEINFDYLMFEKPVCKRGEKRSCSVCIYCKDIKITASVCKNPKSKFYMQSDDSGNMPWNKGCLYWDDGKKHGYSWCGLSGCRWGTTEKLKALDTYCANHIVYVGIAADERERLKKERKSNKIFPLADWNITESECLEGCYSLGFTWGGLYKWLDRVSCKFCALKNLKELRNIYYYMPTVWDELRAYQQRTPRPFKGTGKSVFQLEKRFEFERQRLADGLSIKNRDFYNKLHDVLEKEDT